MIEILLLTQAQCGLCDEAKALLDRLATEYPLAVTALDLATADAEAVAISAGILFPPGILLEGEPVSYGRPSERKLRRAIERQLEGRAALKRASASTDSGAKES